MNKKSAIEMEKNRIIRITRALIRLKHSLNADDELNEVLPERLAEFEAGLQAGELKQLPINLDEVVDVRD